MKPRLNEIGRARAFNACEMLNAQHAFRAALLRGRQRLSDEPLNLNRGRSRRRDIASCYDPKLYTGPAQTPFAARRLATWGCPLLYAWRHQLALILLLSFGVLVYDRPE